MKRDDHEARRDAELGPCHPNLVVVQILSQIIQNLSIHLLRRCMDLRYGSVVVVPLRDSGVRSFRFLEGDIHLLFGHLLGLLHGGSVPLVCMVKVRWLIHRLIDKVALVGILGLAFEGLVDRLVRYSLAIVLWLGLGEYLASKGFGCR